MLLASGVLLLACGSPGLEVSRDQFGAAWPFAAERGTIRCVTRSDRPLVTIDTGDGIQYGINGAARGFGGFPDGLKILQPEKVGADLQPFIERGLALCGK